MILEYLSLGKARKIPDYLHITGTPWYTSSTSDWLIIVPRSGFLSWKIYIIYMSITNIFLVI
jgi:hypothetical protein